jgi:hypothetical protein
MARPGTVVVVVALVVGGVAVEVVGVTGALVVGVTAVDGSVVGGAVDPMAARTAAAALGTVVDRAMAGSKVDVTGGTEVTVVDEDRTSTVRAVPPAALTTSAGPGSRALRMPAETTPKPRRTTVAQASQRAAAGVSRVSSPTDRSPIPPRCQTSGKVSAPHPSDLSENSELIVELEG